MTPSPTLHPTPRWPAVLLAQLYAVGFGIRRVAAAAGLLVVSMTALALVVFAPGDGGLDMDPEGVSLLFVAAPLLPIAVWKGGYDFRHSYLASLPVSRSRHVLTKIAAGWVWLMAGVVALLVWMLACALLTGGSIGVDEMRIVAGDLPAGTSAEAAVAFARRWQTSLWQWLAFFTGPTVGYLFGSAVVLAGSATRRWLAGGAVLVAFLGLFQDEQMLAGRVGDAAAEVLQVVLLGRYGLMNLLAVTDAYALTTAAGEEVPVYNQPPEFATWALATLLWFGLALGAVLLVLWRGRRA